MHGDKYDYSKVDYKNNSTKICIVCPEHGEFWQYPNNHLSGNGCPKCTSNERKSTEKFIEDARKVHGDKYDYSKVDYKNNVTKVCIICPKHGEFLQTPLAHLNGSGCSDCAMEGRHGTTEQFIEKARKVHGDKYDYSKVEFKDSTTKVCIICPKHGEFWQSPNNHLNGRGCQKCIGRDKTTDDFIEQLKEVYGDEYDYSEVNYVDRDTKVCVVCPKHGMFWNLPNVLLRGTGCPGCSRERRRMTTEKFIEKARKVHGYEYDYSDTEYIDGKTKVCINCPRHGAFWQLPNNHLSGARCPKCMQEARNRRRQNNR